MYLSITKIFTNTILPKSLGIAYFSIENGKSVTKTKDVILFLSSLVVGVLVCYFSVIIRSDLLEQKFKIANIGNFLAFLASVIIIILSMLITFAFRHKIWELAQKLDIIQEKFKEINSGLNYERILRIYSFVCLLVLIIIIALEYFLYAVDENPIIWKVIFHLYSTLLLSINIGNCTTCILAVIIRLKNINAICNLMIKRDSSAPKFDEMYIIEKLYDIYSLIIDCCDLINVAFMLQVMLGYGLVFFFTIFVSFTVYQDFSTNGFLSPETSCTLAYCIYYNLFLIFVIAMCTKAEQEAQKSLKFANEMIKRSTDMNKTLMLVTFTTLIKKRGPKFTCGLFDFDWKLVFANISSAATNFVILMQFDMASKQR